MCLKQNGGNNMFAPISGFPNYTYASYPNDFIKIRDRLYNANLIMYVEEFRDSERLFCPEINGDKIKHFTSIILYFSKDDYLKIRGFTIKELESKGLSGDDAIGILESDFLNMLKDSRELLSMAEDEYIYIWEIDSTKATVFESKTEAFEKIWYCGLRAWNCVIEEVK